MASQDPKKWTAKRIVEYYYPGVSVADFADEGDVRIGLLYQATQAHARVEDLGSTGAQMEVSFGQKTVVLPPSAHLTFAPSGRFVTVRRTDGATAESLGRGRTVTIRWSGTRDSGTAGSAPALLNVAGPGESFSSAGHRYRYGTVDITSLETSSGRRLAVVNTLRLGDEYLKGIAEVNPTWPDAALESQAIASRSYALSQVSRGLDSDCGCHMDDGDGPKYDQTFRGWLAESQYGDPNRWAEAVDATRKGAGAGLTALYQGKPINAFYTAATGGMTNSAQEVWGGADTPWATNVADEWSYNAPGNPYRSWSVSVTQSAMSSLFGISDIMTVKVTRTLKSGAVRELTARSLDGRTASVSGSTFRSKLGLRSTYLGKITEQDVVGPVPVPKGGVTLVANPAGDVKDGTLVTLSGIIKKPRAGLTVVRQVQVNGGAWQDRATTTPTDDGRFTFGVPVGGKGTTYGWRVVVLDGSTPVASSPTRVAKVL